MIKEFNCHIHGNQNAPMCGLCYSERAEGLCRAFLSVLDNVEIAISVLNAEMPTKGSIEMAREHLRRTLKNKEVIAGEVAMRLPINGEDPRRG